MEVCFASNNSHKLQEVRQILKPDFRVLSLSDIHCFEELQETMNTFEGNSRQKASHIFEHYRIPCFSDDSGLEVDALNGEPGVFSARYAGEQRNDTDNIRLLLSKMKDVPSRSARFKTVITYIDHISTNTFEGTVEGSIALEPRGILGFGYDPIFVPEGKTLTFAQMSSAEKHSMSHRGKALRKLAVFLRDNHIS